MGWEAGFCVFIGLGCEISKGNSGIRDFNYTVTNTIPKASENELFVRIAVSGCIFMNSRT